MMLTRDIIEETYLALRANKGRSGLTILGIVIGIASVIAMLSIGQGAQSSIQSSIQSIGSNLIIVQPGMQRGVGQMVSQGRGSSQTLKLSDAEAIASQVAQVKAVVPEVSGRYQVKAKANNTNTSVSGTVAAYPDVRNVVVSEGSFITDQNVSSSSKVAVIGASVSDDLFGEDATNVIGSTIRIKSMDFKVIGLLEEKGGGGFGSQDDMIFIPITTAQKFLTGNESLTSISVAAENADVTTTVQQSVTDLLLERHGISADETADFSTVNQSDIAETASSVAEVFTLLLGSIAGISLVVGGIGIMNMMLTNVTERTREIGLRKAIGAQSTDISRQFLVESVMLTFLGGLIGVLLGGAIAWGITTFGSISTEVTSSSVILAFGVSAAIGVIFGYYPARRAANLNPIEALRFE